MSTLVSELSRLRPLLLLQPSILRDPALLQHPAFGHLGSSKERAYIKRRKSKKDKDGKRDKDKDILVVPPIQIEQELEGDADADGEIDLDLVTNISTGEHADTAVSMDMTTKHMSTRTSRLDSSGRTQSSIDDGRDLFGPAQSAGSQQHPKSAVPKPEERLDKKIKDRKGRNKMLDDRAPILSDARAECLLFAARKIGRARSGVIARLVKEREERTRQEREREKVKKAADTVATKKGTTIGHEGTHAFDIGMSSTDPYWMHDPENQPGPSNYSYPVADQSTPRTIPISRHSTSATGMHLRGTHLTSHIHPPVQSPSQPTIAHILSPQTRIMPYGLSRQGGAHASASGAISPPAGLAIVGSSSGSSSILPITAAWPAPSTPTGNRQGIGPGKSSTPVRGSAVPANTPATPLDSLLSAARTLMIENDDDDDDNIRAEIHETTSLSSSTRRRTSTVASLESPVPKKRRIAANASFPGASTSGTGPRTRRQTKAAASLQQPQTMKLEKGKQKQTVVAGKGKQKEVAPAPIALTRVRSALDVLADQAAQEQERRPSAGPASRQESIEPDKRKSASSIAVAVRRHNSIGTEPAASPKSSGRRSPSFHPTFSHSPDRSFDQTQNCCLQDPPAQDQPNTSASGLTIGEQSREVHITSDQPGEAGGRQRDSETQAVSSIILQSGAISGTHLPLDSSSLVERSATLSQLTEDRTMEADERPSQPTLINNFVPPQGDAHTSHMDVSVG
ncbi:uncharacterized protein FIBRA_01930 [Fibroporia radiculosa]|uniref:Uncharacterized protein n=1 Tax=Fibroporia radiculosa TaxID=599839 RepID=J4GLW1_9APHY|nr:uncharacterized protein FIBRA_01930 [Fibroporia radiculosa]CCL99905.1 predicted protein [Fibroporia radiculosa]